MTPDTWHLTHDTWHVTNGWGSSILSKLQLPSSYGLGVMMFWRLGGKGSLTDWLTQSMSDEGDCRRAPATPGLLITQRIQLSWLRSLTEGTYIFLNKSQLRIEDWINVGADSVKIGGKQDQGDLGLSPFESIWTTIWTHLDPFGAIWCYSNPFGAIWSSFGLFGAI